MPASLKTLPSLIKTAPPESPAERCASLRPAPQLNEADSNSPTPTPPSTRLLTLFCPQRWICAHVLHCQPFKRLFTHTSAPRSVPRPMTTSDLPFSLRLVYSSALV